MRALEITPEFLLESPRGSAVQKTELPAEYRKLKVLGRGMTSIVLEKDATTALIFSRDHIKCEYLMHTGIAKMVTSYESHQHPVRGLRDIEIYVLEMPKLEKLSGPNIGLVRRAIKEVDTVLQQNRAKHGGGWGQNGRAHELAVQDTYQHFSEQENHILYNFWNFIVNYDTNQYFMDFGQRQFLQTVEGQVVLIDPVAQRDIIEMLDKHAAAMRVQKEQDRYHRW
jgi:hypothetical protein